MPYKNSNDQKRHYRNNKEAYKWRGLKNLYGLSKEDYLNLLSNQEGKCALCKQERKLNVDHCHETGRVRGLLCLGCNAGLGMLGDNEQGLMKALEYVRCI